MMMLDRQIALKKARQKEFNKEQRTLNIILWIGCSVFIATLLSMFVALYII
jgi:hypothetical protein